MMSAKDIARRLHKMDLTALAVEANVSRRTLYHVRDGTHKPTARTLQRIAGALDRRLPRSP